MINNLPSGIQVFYGDGALKIEEARKHLIDNYIDSNYQLVLPPPINFASHNPSFKFSDSSSNKTLEIVADITREVAIIDSKHGVGINKYCYCNQIVKPFADDFYSSRNPIQVGCEIYGDDTLVADTQVIESLVTSLELLGVKNINITLSNVAITRIILESLNLNEYQESLMHIINKKSTPEMLEFINQHSINAKELLLALMSGDSDAILSYVNNNDISAEISKLIVLKDTLSKDTNARFIIDIADNSTGSYYNGLIFSAYGEGFSKAIARGGRYFNKYTSNKNTQRSATGFSFDLNFILS